MYLIALVPSRTIEQKTKAKMTNGKENIKHSLIAKLTE
jgi:hypothetical protein